MTEIRLIDAQHSKDINLPNEPFKLFGRLIPKYSDGKWSWETELFAPENASEMRFPDEHYDFEQMSENCTFIGARMTANAMMRAFAARQAVPMRTTVSDLR